MKISKNCQKVTLSPLAKILTLPNRKSEILKHQNKKND